MLRANDNPSLAIVAPMVWSVRNVVYSGVLRSLKSRGIDVHILLRYSPDRDNGDWEEGWLEDAASCSEMIRCVPRRSRGASLLDGVFKEGFYSRAGMGTHELFTEWSQREASIRTKLRTLFIQTVGKHLGGLKSFPRYRTWYERGWCRRYFSQDVNSQLQRLSPTAVWLTVWGLAGEEPYFVAAKGLGIPTVTSIVGFDNPFTKGFRPRLDRYLVWNEAMRDALLRLEPDLPPSSIAMTGTPQFDFHCQQELRWDRGKTLRSLGIPGGQRYFLYAANHPVHTPDEVALLRTLVDRLSDDEALAHHWMVVRLHPLDTSGRWQAINGYLDRVVVSHPFNPPCVERWWSVSSLDDQGLLVNSLLHADACISFASTIALDAAILDRPIIALELSGEESCPKGMFFSAYSLEHYRPLVESGGISLAHNWEDVVKLLRQAVVNPEKGRDARREMVRSVCGQVDGRAAERVAESVHGFVTSLHAASSTQVSRL